MQEMHIFENQSNSSNISEFKIHQNSLNYYHYKQAMCAFHPQNFIMNFCKSPQCLMPMCSECVKLHQLEHAQAGTHGNFETIETVGQQCESDLKKILKQLKKQQEAINKFEKFVTEQEEGIFESLTQAQKRAKKIIDDYFIQIKKQIKNQLMDQNSNKQQQLGLVQTKIQEKEKEISLLLTKISSNDRFLKYIIKFYNTNHLLDVEMLDKEMNNNISALSTQLMNLQTNEASLQNIANSLQSFLFLKSGNLNNIKRSSTSMTPKVFTPQVSKVPAHQIMKSSMSIISPIQSKNYWNTSRNLLQPQQFVGFNGLQRSFYNPNQSMRMQYK